MIEKGDLELPGTTPDDPHVEFVLKSNEATEGVEQFFACSLTVVPILPVLLLLHCIRSPAVSL